MINYKVILRILGFLLLIEGFFMLLSSCVSLVYSENDLFSLLISTSIALITGGSIAFLTRKSPKDIGSREGYIVVSLVWVVFSFFGALPFYIGGAIPSFTNAFFETMSGFSTTGASILNDIEAIPHGLLFWRSLTQWLGGMGIIVLSLAILPFLGIGGMQLFIAEVPGPTPDKLHPRIKETAKRLWGIYVLLTIIETILLMLGGMSFFDAINHSFTTMATGGYSTKQASVAYFDSPYLQYVIIVFMFFAGTNFTLFYFALKLKMKKVWRNEEFRYYLGFTVAFTIIITVILSINNRQATKNAYKTIEKHLPKIEASFEVLEKPFNTMEKLLSVKNYSSNKENFEEVAKTYMAIEEFGRIKREIYRIDDSFKTMDKSKSITESPELINDLVKIKKSFERIQGSPISAEYIKLEKYFKILDKAFSDLEKHQSIEHSFRDALFQVVSIMTTTGYATADYLAWTPFLVMLIFVIMFFGGSAGSTGGGIKILRIVLLLKNSALEFKRLIHPNAIIPVRLNHHAVTQSITTNVLAFFMFYIATFVAGTIIMSTLGLDLETSMGATIACLGNIGPGIGDVGPMFNFYSLPDTGKWVLSFMMLLGRLELFTVLILFTRAFWKK